MILPSSAAGPLTAEVGFFHTTAEEMARLYRRRRGRQLREFRPGWGGVSDLQDFFTVRHGWVCRCWVPVGDDWCVMFTDGPNGTTVDGMHDTATAELGVMAVRAVCSPKSDVSHPATMLEVNTPDPAGGPPRNRTLYAAHDGAGRWTFGNTGDPFAFEDVTAYSRRRTADRFTPNMLYRYLGELGIPYDVEPTWTRARVLARQGLHWHLHRLRHGSFESTPTP